MSQAHRVKTKRGAKRVFDITYFGIKISDDTSGLTSQTDHSLRVLLRHFLCHGGKPSQHLTLLVAYDIPLHPVLHLDSLDGFFNFTLHNNIIETAVSRDRAQVYDRATYHVDGLLELLELYCHVTGELIINHEGCSLTHPPTHKHNTQ